MADSLLDNGGIRRLGGDKPRHYIVDQECQVSNGSTPNGSYRV
ncbi:hypothetical protein D1AOALGA4SA_5892 [Olavius algarvensis Delta 1 endosymbiont]|nr:hypothetical protein D1AOALGA4SA_5892 [Olavius algarvensis Delta 1 endosymbiont]